MIDGVIELPTGKKEDPNNPNMYCYGKGCPEETKLICKRFTYYAFKPMDVRVGGYCGGKFILEEK